MSEITPFLWCDGRIAEAVDMYCSVFPRSRVLSTHAVQMARSGARSSSSKVSSSSQFKGGPECTDAVSLYVNCETQAEGGRLWPGLAEGGTETHCGWLKDRLGFSRQIFRRCCPRLPGHADRAPAARALDAMLRMTKIDIAALERAFFAGAEGA